LPSCVRFFCDLHVCQAPLSMEFPRQEYCSGLPFLSSADLPDPGIKPQSPALAGGFSTTQSPGKPTISIRGFSSDDNRVYRNLLLLLSHFSHVRLCVTPQTAATRLPRPWDSPGKNTGVGCHFLLQCMKVKSESEVA